MTALVLASWLCTQAWSWPTVDRATFYRVYWANAAAGPWCHENFVEVPGTACANGTCEWTPELPHADLYFHVIAVNSAGESPWPGNVERQSCEVAS